MKTIFMQNNHYTALEPCHHWAYIALLNLRVRCTQSLLVDYFVSEEEDTEQTGGFFVDIDE